jgi:hypothetical protein
VLQRPEIPVGDLAEELLRDLLDIEGFVMAFLNGEGRQIGNLVEVKRG